MTTTAFETERSHTSAIGAAVRAAARFACAVPGHLVRLHRARRALALLAAQEDYMLSDIGVTRSDLNAALSTPAPKDPSRTLARLANERQQTARAQRRAIARRREARK